MDRQDRMNADNQRIMGMLVDREVYYCASHLISEMSTMEPTDKSMNYSDELINLQQRDDWETPAQEEIETWDESDCIEYLNDTIVDPQPGQSLDVVNNRVNNPFEETDPLEDLQKTALKLALAVDADEFCRDRDIEPHIIEVYEHWIVSDYLAGKLEEQGETIVNDFMGMTIWGRTCSGQAISMDGVIGDICEEMEILVGQKYDWTPKKNSLKEAAPDMLEALKNIENDEGHIPAGIWDMRNNAIAKAEGK